MPGSMECAEFLIQRPAARFPEKKGFSRTCSLLSRYLKERGSFGDLNLAMTCNTESNGAFAASRQPTTMDFFPCDVSCKDVKPEEDALRMTDSGVKISANPGPQTAQMTIFYAGKVMVFDDFPAEKAEEIMNLAGKESAESYKGFSSKAINAQGAFSANFIKNQAESRSSVPPSPNPVPNFRKNLTREGIQPSSPPIACELPIARRASLHRFLEKRKDRITTRAPYQTSGQDTAPFESR